MTTNTPHHHPTQTPGHDPRPETIARGILFRGSALLLCRNVKKGYHYLPGGHIEPGELGAQALARELLEETGLSLEIGPCRALFEVVFGDSGHEINLVFHVEPPRDLPEEIQSREPEIAFDWVEAAALVDLDLRPRSIKAWLVGGAAPEGERISHITDREPT